MPNRRSLPHGWDIWLIVTIALVLRIVWALAVPVEPVSDSTAYETFAQHVAAGVGYGWEPNEPSAFWPPGTSMVYAIFYWIDIAPRLLIALFQAVLGAATVGGVFVLGRQWFNRLTGVSAAALLALWPSQIQFTTVLASETMFAAALVWTLVLWFSHGINLWLRATIVGIGIAALCYIRPTALLFPAIFAVFFMLQRRELWRPIASAAVMAAVMVVCIAPWTIRNVRAFDEFVFISSNGGTNLWMGNNPDSDGGYTPLPEDRLEGMNDAERNRFLRHEARQYILNEPGAFISRTLSKLIRLHDRETIGVVWNEPGLTGRFGAAVLTPLKLLSTGYWYLMLVGGLGGLVMLLRRVGFLRALFHPATLMWGYFAAVHAIIVIQDRYHFPSIPFIALLAGYAIAAIVAARHGGDDAPSSVKYWSAADSAA